MTLQVCCNTPRVSHYSGSTKRPLEAIKISRRSLQPLGEREGTTVATVLERRRSRDKEFISNTTEVTEPSVTSRSNAGPVTLFINIMRVRWNLLAEKTLYLPHTHVRAHAERLTRCN